MTVDSADNKKINPLPNGWQTFALRFVVVMSVLLIVLPTLPALISNLVYSFSGASPKIYWYLSRASGFVTLTILWVSMSLGLGITNKMARLWPGAPTAFAMHQFTSLLGLAFSAYHALVLMGDHFVDFSLPRLMVPFSVEYQTFWVGLGQVCFYMWLLVVISFYFRQRIGQKAWRLIHYVNFAVYAMGFLHGLKSGTDSHDLWAVGYFVLSGLSIMFLLGSRVNEVLLQKKVSLVAVTFSQLASLAERFKTAARTVSQIKINLPSASLLWEQARKSIPSRKTTTERLLEQIEDSPSQDMTFEPRSTGRGSTENSPVEILEGTFQGRKFRVRIFKEPAENPTSDVEADPEAESKQQRLKILSENLRDTLQNVPAEPLAADGQSTSRIFLED